MNTHTRLKNALCIAALFLTMSVYAQDKAKTEPIPQFKTEQEKQDWIKANPDAYAKAGGTTVANASGTDAVPEFKSQAEKDKWLAEHPQNAGAASAEAKTAPAPTVPSAKPEDPTFPVYINTGNPERDAANYEVRKKEWYSNHPAPIHVSKAEFDALTPEKQQAMLKDPNFIVEQ